MQLIFRFSIDHAKYGKRFGLDIPDDSMDDIGIGGGSLPEGETGEDEEEPTATDEAIAEDAEYSSNAPSRQCQTTIENCRAQNPLTCPYHGLKVLKQDIEGFLRQQGVQGQVEVVNDNQSQSGRKRNDFAAIINCEPSQEEAVKAAMRQFFALPGIRGDARDVGYDDEDAQATGTFEIDLLDPNATRYTSGRNPESAAPAAEPPAQEPEEEVAEEEEEETPPPAEPPAPSPEPTPEPPAPANPEPPAPMGSASPSQAGEQPQSESETIAQLRETIAALQRDNAQLRAALQTCVDDYETSGIDESTEQWHEERGGTQSLDAWRQARAALAATAPEPQAPSETPAPTSPASTGSASPAQAGEEVAPPPPELMNLTDEQIVDAVHQGTDNTLWGYEPALRNVRRLVQRAREDRLISPGEVFSFDREWNPINSQGNFGDLLRSRIDTRIPPPAHGFNFSAMSNDELLNQLRLATDTGDGPAFNEESPTSLKVGQILEEYPVGHMAAQMAFELARREGVSNFQIPIHPFRGRVNIPGLGASTTTPAAPTQSSTVTSSATPSRPAPATREEFAALNTRPEIANQPVPAGERDALRAEVARAQENVRTLSQQATDQSLPEGDRTDASKVRNRYSSYGKSLRAILGGAGTTQLDNASREEIARNAADWVKAVRESQVDARNEDGSFQTDANGRRVKRRNGIDNTAYKRAVDAANFIGSKLGFSIQDFDTGENGEAPAIAWTGEHPEHRLSFHDVESFRAHRAALQAANGQSAQPQAQASASAAPAAPAPSPAPAATQAAPVTPPPAVPTPAPEPQAQQAAPATASPSPAPSAAPAGRRNFASVARQAQQRRGGIQNANMASMLDRIRQRAQNLQNEANNG